MTKKSAKKQNGAAEPQVSAEELARKRYRRGRVFLRTGQALMVLGAAVGIVHWLAHVEAFGPGQPPGWLDLVAGYPLAAVLLIVGAIMAGSKPK